MSRRAVPLDGVLPDPGGYSHAVAAGGELLFVAGQVGVDAGGTLAGPDVAAQARQAFANLAAVLGAAGASLDAVVKLTVYLTDAAHAAEVARVRAELLERPYPASTAVIVAGLLDPAWKVEIEAIATLDGR